jgi:hypothetical protein
MSLNNDQDNMQYQVFPTTIQFEFVTNEGFSEMSIVPDQLSSTSEPKSESVIGTNLSSTSTPIPNCQ